MISQFLYIISILSAGAALGWIYCLKFRVKPLIQQNKDLKDIQITEIVTHQGTIHARTSEYPIDACEYIAHQIPDISNLTEDELAHHMHCFTAHMMTRQKRDFMKQLKELKKS